jgi:CheY-like chemotaxis protein
LHPTGHIDIRGGYEATTMPTCNGLPILAMTVNAFVEDKGRCFDVGMNDLIAKPVDLDALFETLLQWLDKAKAAGRLGR